MFTPSGPAGIFAPSVAPGANLGRVFLNEFVCVRNPPPLSFHSQLLHEWLTLCAGPTVLHHQSRRVGLHRPHQLLFHAHDRPLDHRLHIVRVFSYRSGGCSFCV